jgi:tetratricopeptide (TPR) repeat protein
MRRLHEPDAGPLLARSVELGPNRATTHILLGRWFVVFGRRAQGWGELRQAARVDPRATGAVASEMVRLDAELTELEALVTSEKIADLIVPLLEARKRTGDAEAIDASIIERFSPAVPARLRQIARARAAGNLDDARRLADALIAAAPTDPIGYVTASSLAADDAKAEAYLADGMRHGGRDVRLLEELVRRRAVRLGINALQTEFAELQAALEKEGAAPSRIPVLKAQIESARGNNFNAVKYYLDAWKMVPENIGLLESAAELAQRTGQTNYALNLWEKLMALRPDEARYRERVDAFHASSKLAPVPSASQLLPELSP